ncbi:hypothetical protein Rsub_00312 [Raphidocelis subcapitata]|uniref:EF-hand domain-containing protein n=1 Tax=Raphidocelis subcapitata TaxID=307507 RepID=A0A2V0NK14_9CHLO|nr:hypothetical protein Rsub_00312 [Raphidocelis subcapitata]|eukprot:GBF87601.1 hypothetical protein Rsub_00312 [Raphidocelis subcapitata]
MGVEDRREGVGGLHMSPLAGREDGRPQMLEPTDLAKIIPQPGAPRADVVPSRERPEGHPATPRGRAPLLQHLDYFDLNKDGRITVIETWRALRYLRLLWEPFNTVLCFWLAVAFHLPLFWWTQDGWFPSPLLTIQTRNAPRVMRLLHGSSSKTLDGEGRFIPQAFEKLWASYARGATRMTPRDVAAAVYANASAANPFGAAYSAFQWGLALWAFHDDDWCLRKNDVRGLYDGTAFYRLADRNGFPWYGMAARRDGVAERNMG